MGVSSYRRLEIELANTREALVKAAEKYTEALQALSDLLKFYDFPPSGWTPKDLRHLERIRAIAEGK